MSPAGWDGRQYSRLCYNDIQPLYQAREIDERTFPYVHGRIEDGELVDGAIEYPVLTGVFMWTTGLWASDTSSYLKVSAAALAPFALVVALLLGRMTGRRALLWAAAPALVLYAFHNWDLLAVAAVVGGIWLWWRERPSLAAVAFGVGAALKMYPALFVFALVVERVLRRDIRGAASVAGIGAGTFALINLPFAVANPSGWFATYAFHSERTANYDSIWSLGWPHAAPATLNALTAVLTALFVIGATVYAWRRDGNDVFLPLSGALLAAFLLWNKVHSPQYTLWLLPFFAVLRVHIGWWIAYAVADLAVYVGVFRWFFEYLYESRNFTLAKKLMIGGVWTRAALLLALFVVFSRARSAVVPRPSLSHPIGSVSDVGDRLPAQS